MFFFVCSKQERISKSASEVFFFTNFCLVLNNHFVFSCPRGWGDFFWKKVTNWRSRHRYFVEIFFPKNDLKKKWFFISAKRMQSFGIIIYCTKTQKKSPFWKKLFFPSMSLFSRTAFKFFSWKSDYLIVNIC